MKSNNCKKGKAIILISTFFVLCFFCILFFILYNSKSDNDKELMLQRQKDLEQAQLLEKQLKIDEARLYIDSLYLVDIPNNYISEVEYDEALRKIEAIDDQTLKVELINEIQEMKKFSELELIIKKLVKEQKLVSTYIEADIEKMNSVYNELNDIWKYLFKDDVDLVNNQYQNIKNVESMINNLFTDDSLTNVKSKVTRKDYNNTVSAINKLVQDDLVTKYNSYLEKVLKVVEEKERRAEEARKKALEEKRKKELEEAKIKAAWVILNTPYISQNNNKVYNGCEVASLLMALQYKGYLENTTLKDIADAVPKSDDPHQGFFRDIYGYDPRDLPHWIAPDALAKFGREYSGNQNVLDITGYTVTQLKKELDNNNPVIVYATGGLPMKDPENWIEEVPGNLHVMLLIGYNPITKELLINNPWTRNGTGKVYISESRFTEIYNLVGKKSVVIR